MSVLVVVQARTGSTRLPGKVLEVVAGEPLVKHALFRAVHAAELLEGDWAILAVPACDVEAFAAVDWWPQVTWPDPDDVLGRFQEAAETVFEEVTAVVRLTADNPLVDPQDIAAVAHVVESGAADYASNVLARRWCDGVDVEAFTADLLRRADAEATDPYDREHVTPWIIRNAERPWHVGRHVEGPMRRWTIDTAEDLAWFRVLAEHIEIDPAKGKPTTDELLAFLREHPELERWQDDVALVPR